MKQIFLLLFILISTMIIPGQSSAQNLSLLAAGSPEMSHFDGLFKEYLVSLKKNPERDRALKAVTGAIASFDGIVSQVSTDHDGLRGRLTAIQSLLSLAKARILQNQLEEALELTVAIRTELYLLHEENHQLSSYDHMIRFHNGILHRLEPLVDEERYLEMELMIPAILAVLEKFSTPPVDAVPEVYENHYNQLEKAVREYITVIKETNDYVDPENGAMMLQENLHDAHLKTHKHFGLLWLTFPDSTLWPK